jgi:hypothetical protein
MPIRNRFRRFPRFRSGLFLTAILLGPVSGLQAQTFGPPANSAEGDSSRPQSAQFIANLDYRNSFIQHHPVNVWGVNAGVRIGPRRNALTVGYYWLSYNAQARLINWHQHAGRWLNITHYTKTDLWFGNLMYWKNIAKKPNWTISLPIELGIGVASTTPTNWQTNQPAGYQRQAAFVPAQLGVYGEWKATRWSGLGAQIGYRHSVLPTIVKEPYNGVYYSVGATFYPALIKDSWRLVNHLLGG